MLRRAQGQHADAEALLRQVLLSAPESADARALFMEYANEDGTIQQAEEFLRRLHPAAGKP